MHLFGSATYSVWLVVINETIMQQNRNRFTATEIRWNKNEDARTSAVLSTNRQLPMQLAQELNSVTVD